MPIFQQELFRLLRLSNAALVKLPLVAVQLYFLKFIVVHILMTLYGVFNPDQPVEIHGLQPGALDPYFFALFVLVGLPLSVKKAIGPVTAINIWNIWLRSFIPVIIFLLIYSIWFYFHPGEFQLLMEMDFEDSQLGNILAAVIISMVLVLLLNIALFISIYFWFERLYDLAKTKWHTYRS